MHQDMHVLGVACIYRDSQANNIAFSKKHIGYIVYGSLECCSQHCFFLLPTLKLCAASKIQATPIIHSIPTRTKVLNICISLNFFHTLVQKPCIHTNGAVESMTSVSVCCLSYSCSSCELQVNQLYRGCRPNLDKPLTSVTGRRPFSSIS